MENSKSNALSRDRILSGLCLIVFVLLFIFSCMYNTINIGATLVGTFGILIYPCLVLLCLICFAKFLGLNYKRSIKATIFMICFIYSLLLVIHSIRTYSILDAVVSKSTFLDYLNYSYSNLTLLGSLGCLFAGCISYLIGGMGSIIVYVIVATIFIGLFIDYELYGKYDQKHIKKLHSKKMREKVIQSDKNINPDGKPNYSFSNSDTNNNYSEKDVLAEITANYSEINSENNFEQKQYSESDMVGEITDNQIYDNNQSYYASSENNQYNNNFEQPNYQSEMRNNNNSWNGNPFGVDAVDKQEQNHFSNNFYQGESYPNVYDENEERRKFLQATFNTDYVPTDINNSGSINSSNENYSNSSDGGYLNESYSEYNQSNGYLSNQQNDSYIGYSSSQSSNDSYSGYSSSQSSDNYSDYSYRNDTNNSAYSENNDVERISKNDMEWKFNDDDFNYFTNTEEENSQKSSTENFNSSLVDDKISQILNGDENIENSVKNDVENSFDLSVKPSIEEDTISDFSDNSNDNLVIEENIAKPSFDYSSKENFEESSPSTHYEEPKVVRVPAKEPAKKSNSGLKMGLVGMKYNKPSVDLLNPIEEDRGNYEEEQARKAKGLEIALEAFNIPVSVANIVRGPKITRYELSVPLGVSIKKIPNYELDIKKTLAAKTISIQAPIPGTEYVGVELENDTFTNVSQRELFESDAFKNCTDPLPVAIGKDISGEIVVSSLTKMVHLLIAGQTGSGKSVFIHSLIMSLIFKYSPDDLRMVLIDPKKVEFNIYNGLPHLLTPEVVMGTEKAVNALKWCVKEMDRRYDLMSRSGYNNIVPYNNSELVKSGQFEKLPYIVIIVDEFAEVIMSNKKEAEAAIQRITQLARACGMHLVLATQRPSVDVMSGVIKNNVPTRIAFSLSSSFDSKTILGTVGAENLLGQGDMLYRANGSSLIMRLQAAFCSNDEIHKVIEYDIKNNKVNYDESVENMINSGEGTNVTCDASGIPMTKEVDPLFKTAIKIFMLNGGASASYLQRRLGLGYSRASKILDQLEVRGYISPASGSKQRKVLITPEQYKQDFNEDFDSRDIEDNEGY